MANNLSLYHSYSILRGRFTFKPGLGIPMVSIHDTMHEAVYCPHCCHFVAILADMCQAVSCHHAVISYYYATVPCSIWIPLIWQFFATITCYHAALPCAYAAFPCHHVISIFLVAMWHNLYWSYLLVAILLAGHSKGHSLLMIPYWVQWVCWLPPGMISLK